MSDMSKMYNLKYTLAIVSKRQKLQIEDEKDNLEDQLNILIGDFEPQVYAVLDAMGISGTEADLLMGYAKRVFKLGLSFWGTTFTAEWPLIKDEYVLRGFDKTTLDGLDTVILHKIKKYRGIYEGGMVFFDDWGYGGFGNMGKIFFDSFSYNTTPPDTTLIFSEGW